MKRERERERKRERERGVGRGGRERGREEERRGKVVTFQQRFLGSLSDNSFARGCAEMRG